jgi:hypothetical protein
MIEYRHSIIPDIPIVAAEMRPEDRDEVWAGLGETPRKTLFGSYVSSTECFTIYHVDSGKPLAMFGYRITEPKICASIWMLAGTGLMEHRWTFLKRSKSLINYIQSRAPLLYNTADCRNAVHIKWLEWLDFKFIRTIPDFGHLKLPFVEFARLRN